MSEPKLISPMLDGFSMGEAISDHHGVRCYPAMPNNSDSRYIVKIISIPASQVQLQALLLTGAFQNEKAAGDYFHSLAKGIAEETEILAKLSRFEGFMPFEGCQIVPMENAVGYDVYLLGTYKRTLARHLRKSNLTHLEAVNLGLDLCASLAVARQNGYLYTNTKPENIFICNDKEYRLGDLGFLRLDALKYASLPDRCISPYTSPEVVDAYSDINITLDTYAVGLVLYQVYNGGELPFEGRAPAEALPSPVYADYEMAEIIMKACAPDPKDRWQDPISMGQALVAYMQRNTVNDTPIVTAAQDHSNEVPLVYNTEPEAALSADDTQDSEAAAPDDGTIAPEADPVEQLQLDDFDSLFGVDEEETLLIEDVDFTPEPIGLTAPVKVESIGMDHTEPEDLQNESEVPSEEDDELLNLSFLDDLVSDDTSPSEDMAAEFNYEAVGVDASDILAQADDLLQHETPEGVVAPEPIDINTIVPEKATVETINISLNTRSAAPAAAAAVAETVVVPAADTLAPAEDDADDDEFDEALGDEFDEFDEEDEHDEEDSEDEEDESVDESGSDGASRQDYDLVARRSDHRRQIARKKARRSKVIRRWIAAIVILLVMGGLAFGGYLFYKDYYICSVISLVPSGSEDRLVVTVTADIDESLLTVYCIDTHGNSLKSSVVNGQATFTGLTPNTLYSLKVEVSGMHKLTGETADSYTTPVQTEIVSFSAVTGTEPGSAILNFTVDGMDSETWTVTYSAEGVEEQKKIFSGHTVNISGLIAGKTYTFVLDSGTDMYIVGSDTLVHTAVDPVFAQNLAITGCNKDSLDVRWETPEGAAVESWTVRCYSDSGYDETVETTVPYVTFKGLDGNEAHTVEVTAKGMSAGVRTYMTANAVTVIDVSAEKVGINELKLTWNFTGNEPAGNWLLTYTVDGAAMENMVRTDTNSAVISPLIPGGTYTVSVILEDGTTVFSHPLTITLEEAPRFSGYLTGADYITARMCRTPDKADWTRTDLAESDYTDTFQVGTRASFLLYTSRNYNTSNDVITTMFVIHDENGVLISSNITQSTWTNMWFKRYCELDIPVLPDVPGNYTITIYFNGTFVHSQNFTVTQ